MTITSEQDAITRKLLARRAGGASRNATIRRMSGDQPLSCGQERMWLTEQMADHSSVSNFTFAVWIEGELDRSALARAVGELHRRHEILRTVLVVRNGGLVQHVLPAEPVRLDPLDVRGGREEARRIVADLGDRPYDLAAEPGVRWTLLRLGADQHVLAICMHHAVADAWSEGILRRELSALYRAYHLGESSGLPDLPVQYGDYAGWHRSRLADGALDAELESVVRRLTGAPSALPLPGGRQANGSASGDTLTAGLPASVAASVSALASRTGTTPFMVLLSAFAVVLRRFGGASDMVIGIPVAGRSRPELESLIGFFVNTIPVRLQPAADQTFAELLLHTRDRTLDAYACQDVPFDQLVERLRPQREPGRQPLVQVMFQLLNTPDQPLCLPGLTVDWEQLFDQTAPLDLAVSLLDSGAGLSGWWEYRSSQLTPEAVRRMQGAFERVLRIVLAEPDVRLADIEITDERERTRLLAWGQGGPVSGGPLVHEEFEERARSHPDRTAVVADGVVMTYRELSERSGMLARRLRAAGVGPGTLAGVMLPRGLDAVVTILAVLRAGGGYLPLDPDYPAERLTFMITDAEPVVVVTSSALIGGLPHGRRSLLVDGEADSTTDAGDVGEGAQPEDVAYVIYTSGSTGRPKGVAVTHRSLTKHLKRCAEQYPQTGRHGTLVHSALGFDFTVTPLFLSLISGLETVMVNDSDTVGALATELLRPDRDYSWLKLTPAHLDTLRLRMPADARITSVRTVVVGGEQLRRDSVLAWQTIAPKAKIINEYGPTETTVGVVVHTADVRPPEEQVPIGRPVRASTAYVLDEHGRLVPPGVAGELFIGGEALARGYLRRPALTADRFVPDPFIDSPGARMYRTGDIARWRETGELDFLGRIDGQVKIRGYRVEVGEIEAALTEHPGVADAAVTVREDGEERSLVAYLVAGPERPDAAELRRWLRSKVPSYLVPAVFHEIDVIPVNSHGKVDRSRLPDVTVTVLGDYLPPRTDNERAVAALWSDLLGVERVGMSDDFFALGGDSLSAARMAAVLSSGSPGTDVATLLTALFRDSTAASVAAGLTRSTSVECPVPASRSGMLPLSSGQRSMWFYAELAQHPAQYLAPMALRLGGTPDVAALQRSLVEVVRRHEVLRTGVVKLDGVPVGKTYDPDRLRFRVEAAPAGSDPAGTVAAVLGEELATPIDLERDLPIRARLVRLAPGDWVFVLVLHHIASDAESNRILLDELGAYYQASTGDGRADLVELPFQYADYADWQNQRVEGTAFDGDLDFWWDRLTGLSDRDLPLERPRSGDDAAAVVRTTTGRETVDALRAGATREGATLFMALNTAFRLLLADWSGETDIAIGVPVSVRAGAGAEGLVGLFVNTVVLRHDIDTSTSFTALLRAERHAATSAYTHQDVPFEQVVRRLRPRRGRFRNPLFQVMHAYGDRSGPAAVLPGLSVRPIDIEPRETAFDLSLDTVRAPDGSLESTFTYPRELFAPETIAQLADRWNELLVTLAATPHLSVSTLPTGERQS
jgi:amino acid adenylation domain-containing protein